MLKLKPGMLVSVRTRMTGGVSYSRIDLDETRDGASETIEWKTVRRIDNVEEFEAAKAARNTAARLIRTACVHTSFGYLCPAADVEKLDGAITKAKEIVDQHNAKYDTTRIVVNVLRGTIASTDDEAAESIATEVRELLADMDSGIRNLNVEEARKAASNAKRLGQLLDEAQTEKIGAAVAATRKAAREIVKRIEDEGEEIVAEIASEHLGPVSVARAAFLDLDANVATESVPAVNVQRGAEIEIDDAEPDLVLVSGEGERTTITISEPIDDYSQAPPAEERDAILAEMRDLDLDDADSAQETPAAAPARDLDLD